MTRITLALALWLLAVPALAATYYVRPDGGTAAQCNGTQDAAYPGSGTGLNCAWSHPNWALGNAGSGSAPLRIAGSDTLIIKNGSYGIGFNGTGDKTGCGQDSSCFMRPIPSGTAQNPTRILGEQATALGGQCRKSPELWGSVGLSRVLDLTGSSNVVVECLEITDRAVCINGATTNACSGTGDWARVGVRIYESTDITLRDVNVHGMGAAGINAGRLYGTHLYERVRLWANGRGGWDGNVAGAGLNISTGTVTMRGVTVAFNGCQENYPAPTIVQCGDQNVTSVIADGIGLDQTGGTWIIEDSFVHHNTQDGIDLLYIDQSGGNSTIRRTRVWGNAGNQIKTRNPTLIENSYVNGNCDYFTGRYGSAFALTGGGCRAAGYPVTIAPPNVAGDQVTIRYSTITGSGGCLVGFSANAAPTSATNARIENSVLYGQTYIADTQDPKRLACLVDNAAGVTVGYFNNTIDNTRTTCPSGNGNTCAAPQLRSLDRVTFNPQPVFNSNVLGGGNTSLTTPATDLRGNPRPGTPARGAFEFIP